VLHNCCASAFIDAYNSRFYLKNAGKLRLMMPVVAEGILQLTSMSLFCYCANFSVNF
jgi:hypothetical protein